MAEPVEAQNSKFETRWLSLSTAKIQDSKFEIQDNSKLKVVRACLAIVSILFGCLLPSAQGRAQGTYNDFSSTIDKLFGATDSELEGMWKQLVSDKRIPLTCGDSVAFLYHGHASSVAWVGDFNAWGYDKQFANKGKQIRKTDYWILRTSVPKDARLDYKILVDDRQWLLDPSNVEYQWSGVGGGSLNSELRMPYWRRDSLTSSRIAAAPRGQLQKDIVLNSRELGYQITYGVYLPYGFRGDKHYPVVYVTDGYEYMHERMGNMVAILDNLIYLRKIGPVVAVFIDHREPVNRLANRRMTELSMNEKYLNFIIRELIPVVEKNLSVAPLPTSRLIMGNSAGGLFSAWAAFSRPDIFPLAGVQSPSFTFQPRIYAFCESAGAPPAKIFMTSGLIHDSHEGARKMKEVLDRKSCVYEYKEVDEGHSWGNWRDLTDDLLIYLLNQPADLR